MLRVGLTGGLGSGKTTVSAMFAARGAHILSADEIGRALMQPGNAVFNETVRAFGTTMVTKSGSIDRLALARAAFRDGRIEELNRIVHPAVIAEEEHRANQIFSRDADAVVIVESALIFEASRGQNTPDWRNRFDKLILLIAPERVKLDRFIARVTDGRRISESERAVLEADGRSRIAAQIPDQLKIPLCDYIIVNAGSIQDIQAHVARIWLELKQQSTAEPGS